MVCGAWSLGPNSKPLPGRTPEPFNRLAPQGELDKERQRAKAELAARDMRINELFEELTATQSEVQEVQQQLTQVRVPKP